MLKSHFNIATPKEEVVEEAEVVVGDEQIESEVEAEKPKEEESSRYPERKLKESEVSIRLSMLGKTATGDCYAYLKVSCTNLKLTHLKALKVFSHLQFVDVSDNLLDLDGLQLVTDLPYLIYLRADKNLLESAALKKTKYLQVMVLNHNNITSVHDVFQPELTTFEVGNNQITRIYFDNRMPNLKCLDFRYNIIEEILYVNFPNLDSLYLAGNKIKSLIGLEKLVNLRILHVRNNPIRSLDGFDESLTKLQYINLRNCKVSTLKQVKKLKVLISLETLIMKGCPYMGGTGDEDGDAAQEEEDPEIRVEVLATLPRLKRLNKGVITPEERAEAKELMNQWLEDGEKEDEEEIIEEAFKEEETIDED